MLNTTSEPWQNQAITDIFVKASFSAAPETASTAFHFNRANMSDTTSGQ